MSWKYILEGKIPVPIEDIIEWGAWCETADRTVKRTELPDGVRVSTVFLGLNSQFLSSAPPLLFETMIFGGEHDLWQKKYCTWEEAEAGHQEAIEMIFKS